MAQGLHPLGPGFLEPLAHCPLCHAQCGSDIFLFPSLFMQFPGAYPSSFAPIFGRCRFLAHTSFHRYVSSFSLASSVAINNRVTVWAVDPHSFPVVTPPTFITPTN